MRHALNVLAEVAPDWLIEHMQPEWAKRYQSRFSDFRLPKEEKARKELAEQIGADGRDLFEKMSTSTTHSWLQEIPAIDILRRSGYNNIMRARKGHRGEKIKNFLHQPG